MFDTLEEDLKDAINPAMVSEYYHRPGGTTIKEFSGPIEVALTAIVTVFIASFGKKISELLATDLYDFTKRRWHQRNIVKAIRSSNEEELRVALQDSLDDLTSQFDHLNLTEHARPKIREALEQHVNSIRQSRSDD